MQSPKIRITKIGMIQSLNGAEHSESAIQFHRKTGWANSELETRAKNSELESRAKPDARCRAARIVGRWRVESVRTAYNGGMEDKRLDGWPMPEADLLAILRAIAAEIVESR